MERLDYDEKVLNEDESILKIEEEEDVETTEEDMDYMNEMFAWEFTIEFDRNVRKYDVQEDTAVTVSSDKRTYLENGNIFDVAEKETKWVFKIK